MGLGAVRICDSASVRLEGVEHDLLQAGSQGHAALLRKSLENRRQAFLHAYRSLHTDDLEGGGLSLLKVDSPADPKHMSVGVPHVHLPDAPWLVGGRVGDLETGLQDGLMNTVYVVHPKRHPYALVRRVRTGRPRRDRQVAAPSTTLPALAKKDFTPSRSHRSEARRISPVPELPPAEEPEPLEALGQIRHVEDRRETGAPHRVPVHSPPGCARTLDRSRTVPSSTRPGNTPGGAEPGATGFPCFGEGARRGISLSGIWPTSRDVIGVIAAMTKTPATTVLCAAVLAWAVSGPATGDLVAQERFAGSTQIGVVDSVWSPTLEEHRPYLVYTPPSYSDTTLTPQAYPVVYVLDGDAHFHSLSGLIQILSTGVNGTYVVPEMIVVAVPNTDRTRDLTPTHDTTGLDGAVVPFFSTSGGNPQFFQFLEQELIPRIESDYRASSYRTLVGHSFGGITVINALYTIPQAFHSYVSIDPSLWWDEEVLLRKARDYFSTSNLTGKSLYVAQANTVQPDDTIPNRHFSAISRFNEVMKAYDRSGLRYAFRYYPDDDHGSVPLISEYDGLRFAFDGYRVPLARAFTDPTVLESHFQSVSDHLGHEFGPTEGMLRLLGQFTLQTDTTAALAYAEMRVERFPESWSAHEFLGDVGAAMGDLEQARIHYGHSLELNPGNEQVLEKLDSLEGDGGSPNQSASSDSRSRGRVNMARPPSSSSGHSSLGRSQYSSRPLSSGSRR